ncbi:hypothetical protein C8J57DRAFT_1620708 [Mycena rebaudengoi]|nr:hypothetical protein C8J57DRAFT_1620708 [Mycena rebaudengoi]
MESSGDSEEQPLRKKKKPNQHLPTPPDEDLLPLIRYYWILGLTDQGITDHCMHHFDSKQFGLSVWTVKRRRTDLNLRGTRQQAATWEEIEPIYQQIRARFPTMGARQMVNAIRQDHGIKVSEKFLSDAFNAVEREAVQSRKHKCFRCKHFYCAGVNDIMAFDQHDKWKCFGLWLHVGIDPFPGRILWLKIWWTNRNPRLITSYYLQASRKMGGIPLITQSDPGSENYGIANCHTVTRQRLDPELEGTLQHWWMNKKAMNVKPEATWSMLRRQWTPGFETLLDFGINTGLYNLDDPLEKLVFRWLAIPWLQMELDSWAARFNSTIRRADKHKILPRGIPDLIVTKPELYGTSDFKVRSAMELVLVSPELFDDMEQKWAPPSDPVFELVPSQFGQEAAAHYDTFGSPPVNSDSFWTVYSQLLHAFCNVPLDPQFLELMKGADDARFL